MDRQPLQAAARLRETRAELLAALEGLSETEMAMLPVAGTWSTRDILAHISGWAAWDLAGIRSILAGEQPDWAAIQDVDLFNARLVDERHGWMPGQILAEMEATQAELQELLACLSDADRESLESGAFRGPYWNDLAGWLQVAQEHAAEHAAQIRAWRARRPLGLDLKGDPLTWLLEEGNPSLRYWTLRDLLGRPADDPEVRAAQAAILAWPPVAELLAAQKRDGSWVKRDYYLPKHEGTFWTLTVLADLGLTAEQEQIERACEFMFTFQRENGAFCRRRRVAGRGKVWDDHPGPCTHARIVRFLIQFGYGEDPRTRQAIDWLLAAQHEDGMWDCHPSRRYGCLRATLDMLRVAAFDPEAAAHPAVQRGAEVVCGLLLKPAMSKYHVGSPWTALEYPYFDYGLIPGLDALLRLGYTAEHPRIGGALDYLLSRQLPGGAWPLDQKPYRLPLDVGRPGEPNEWLTLDALRVVKAAAERIETE